MPILDRLRQLQDRGIEELVFVGEIKSDDDESEETRAKGIFGKEHFQSVNNRLRMTNPIDLPAPFRNSLNQLYGFWILRPSEFSHWFAQLRTGSIAFAYPVGTFGKS
jgi:hypothetical protein